ncbi:hypothetical protein V8E54_014644 [Elaphomyces granulatus]
MTRHKKSKVPIPSEPPNPVITQRNMTRPRDPNWSDSRLQVQRRCIYERRLPGEAYITAHVERLQHGYFSSPATSDRGVDNVDFLAINFVFHPSDGLSHRFKAATIRVSIQNDLEASDAKEPFYYPQENPRFLMHAPHIIYGAVSPETLQWTFSLAGSLGISDTPVAASLAPGATMGGQYELFGMMKIQGSARTLKSPYGLEFDVEDGEIVWSLEENNLQQSGLPREFTFVMLIEKPQSDSRLSFSIEVDPVIQTWFGRYPNWWVRMRKYQPLNKRQINFRHEIGQRFEPTHPTRGFNFATLACDFDEYVNMPGGTYSSNISPDGVVSQDPTKNITNSETQQSANGDAKNSNQSTHSNTHDYSVFAMQQQHLGIQSNAANLAAGTLNVRVLLDRSVSTHLSYLQREKSTHSSPNSTTRRRSLRRSRSREGLNQHGIRLELNEDRPVTSADTKRYSHPS